MSDGKRVRLNLELGRPSKDQLDRIKTRTGATTITEVIRRAIRLYDLLSTYRSEGFQIILRRDEDEKEVILL